MNVERFLIFFCEASKERCWDALTVNSSRVFNFCPTKYLSNKSRKTEHFIQIMINLTKYVKHQFSTGYLHAVNFQTYTLHLNLCNSYLSFFIILFKSLIKKILKSYSTTGGKNIVPLCQPSPILFSLSLILSIFHFS